MALMINFSSSSRILDSSSLRSPPVSPGTSHHITASTTPSTSTDQSQLHTPRPPAGVSQSAAAVTRPSAGDSQSEDEYVSSEETEDESDEAYIPTDEEGEGEGRISESARPAVKGAKRKRKSAGAKTASKPGE